MNNPDPLALLRAAAAAAWQAYSPYSSYSVGAALLCADGSVVTGCNVENASYGLTLCAERTAVVTAIAAGRRDFVAIAVTAAGDALPYPCGACRQVLAEFCPATIPVFIARADDLDAFEAHPLQALLPYAFRASRPRD